MKSKLFLILSACTMGFTMQSCTDFEKGAAIGAVAGGIIGSANRGGDRHHYHDCRHCYTYDSQLSLMAYRPSAAPESDESVSVAQKYNIPIDAAQAIVSSLRLAQNEDYRGLKSWGLRQDDVIAFYNDKALSPESIYNVSQKLGFDQDETKELLSDMSADVQAEKVIRNL